MHGELIAVWGELQREVWFPLSDLDSAPEDLFAELYRDIAKPPAPPVSPTFSDDAYDVVGNLFRAEDIAADAAYKQALSAFDAKRAAFDEAVSGTGSVAALDKLLREVATTEAAAVASLEKISRTIEALDTEPLYNSYFQLVEHFLSKYSLRYDLRRPFSLHPTLPGIFGSLARDLRKVAHQDAHLLGLLNEFEESIRDLKTDRSAGRIKTCLHKQFNLAEALGKRCPNVDADTLGEICVQLKVWPHVTIREALRKLYGFRSDYPGLGHAGNPQSVLREIEMKDLIAVSVMLAGFVPYLCDQLNSEAIFAGAQ